MKSRKSQTHTNTGHTDTQTQVDANTIATSLNENFYNKLFVN